MGETHCLISVAHLQGLINIFGSVISLTVFGYFLILFCVVSQPFPSFQTRHPQICHRNENCTIFVFYHNCRISAAIKHRNTQLRNYKHRRSFNELIADLLFYCIILLLNIFNEWGHVICQAQKQNEQCL